MSATVFFSWQSDRRGRNFIEKALETAIKRISENNLELVEAVRDGIELDRDTKGVPGSPAIFETILKKIERAAIFVADLTFVGTNVDGELLPNPNVLLEYGYALKALGDAQIVAVINTIYGEPSSLPFDLKSKRFPIKYALAGDADQPSRAKVREKLAKDLEEAVRLILSSAEFKARLAQPPQPSPPRYREPKNGRARFREEGESIGVAARSPLAPFIQGATSPVYLSDLPAMWLRVMPKVPIAPPRLVTAIESAITQLSVLPMMETNPTGKVRGGDGAGFFSELQKDDIACLVFMFTDGEIWTINTLFSRFQGDLIFFEEERLVMTLQQCAKFLENFGIAGPYCWVAGIEGIEGRYFPPAHNIGRGWGPCTVPFVEVEGNFNTQDNAKAVLEPFFAELWDKCGRKR